MPHDPYRTPFPACHRYAPFVPPVFEPALCIRHWEWSETSQIAALFTRSLGMVRVLAKGSRRPASPYSGGLEMLTAGEAGIIIKPNADLAILTEWDLRDPMLHLRRSLSALNAGLYIADLIRHLVIDAEPHPALFDHTLAALRSLADDPRNTPGVLLRLQWAALVESGYQPELHRDVRTAQPLKLAAEMHFDPSLGGLVSATSHAHQASTWRLRRQTVELLRTLHALPADQRAIAPAAAVQRAAFFLASYVGWLLGRPLPTASLVFSDIASVQSRDIGHSSPTFKGKPR